MTVMPAAQTDAMAQEPSVMRDDSAHETPGATPGTETDPRLEALQGAIARDRWPEAVQALDALQSDASLELDEDDQAVFHACRAMALGRMGRFDEAAELLRTLPHAQRLRDTSMPHLIADWLAWAAQLHAAQRFADAAEVVEAAQAWPLAPQARALADATAAHAIRPGSRR